MDQFAAVVETLTLGMFGLAFLALVVEEVIQLFPRRRRTAAPAAGAAAAPKSSVTSKPGKRGTRGSWDLQGQTSPEAAAL
ncbi:MAG: hypothetical protein P4L83_13775 [Nevskia sp.]|nr:hypothetical protein [Nevskia sp.]